MDNTVRTTVGQPVARIDTLDKATGNVKYVGDLVGPSILHAKLVTSTEAHAILKSVETTEAWKVPGVRAIITGDVFPFHIGPLLGDRPPLAFKKVRYYGEPVAIIVADEEYQGKLAASKVKVTYESLPVVNSVQQAFQMKAPLVHDNSGDYTKIFTDVYSVPGTNIGSHNKIRKGDFAKAWAGCAETITATYAFNLSDHAALETRCTEVQINSTGIVTLIIGAAVSLTTIVESNLFPLLGETVQRITDHTSRNKIAIGGNLNSHFIYKEGILPFLLVNAKGMIIENGKETILPLEQILNKGLDEGEFLVQIHVDQSYVSLPFSTIKRTRMSKVGYPIVTVAALTKDNRIRIAFSGVCEFPFRSDEIEMLLNDSAIPKEERINQVIDHLPGPVVQDIHASAKYREFVLKNVLTDTLEVMEGNR